MELEVQQTKALGIQLGDGYRVVVQMRCQWIALKLDAWTIHISSFVFELGMMDIILGIAWLESLGGVWTDWKRKIVRYMSKGQEVQLHGFSYSKQEYDSFVAL